MWVSEHDYNYAWNITLYYQHIPKHQRKNLAAPHALLTPIHDHHLVGSEIRNKQPTNQPSSTNQHLPTLFSAQPVGQRWLHHPDVCEQNH